MHAKDLQIPREHVQKLLSAANGDTALLYFYLQSGNDLQNAPQELHLAPAAVECAAATLRQLGLWQEQKEKTFLVGERPSYTESDVLRAMDSDMDFKGLYGEVQSKLGRTLNTEELKIILGFVRYLGLPHEVICILVGYCKERARQKGSTRNPSLRSIEKEAYKWAENGIDTLTEASAYIQQQTVRTSRLGQLMNVLQIRGRSLTAGEERYAQQWLDWGFDMDAIGLAYERTCLNTGGLSWAYMNKILTRWHSAGLLTAQAVRSGDQKPGNFKAGQRQLDADELAAIEKMFQEV